MYSLCKQKGVVQKGNALSSYQGEVRIRGREGVSKLHRKRER